MKQKKTMATRALAYCAMLAAISVALARLAGLMPDESSRFSIEAIPIFMAGMFFGPLAGGLVGFAADFVGCLFSPFGFNPLFCIPPILYGVFGGVFQKYLARKMSIPRLAVSFLPPVVLGSILYQSFALALVYFSNTFTEGLILKLTTRSVQFAITMVLDVLIIFVIFKAKVFDRLGVWPPKKR
ncbi:MAG: folate family ECF transporter S component [Oscillospiraceae bacterium]|nr:folate family ECF transporter S component [Oscillospiraceae bacterium]